MVWLPSSKGNEYNDSPCLYGNEPNGSPCLYDIGKAEANPLSTIFVLPDKSGTLSEGGLWQFL